MNGVNALDMLSSQTAVIADLLDDRIKLRLLELGFVPGQKITKVQSTMLGSALMFALGGRKYALSRSEASSILVYGMTSL